MDSSSATNATDFVHVALSTLGGQHFGEFEVPFLSPVLALKQQIKERFNVPVDCQKLLLDADMLRDEAIIGECCQRGTLTKQTLDIVFILVLERLMLLLSSSSKAQRIAAEKDLELLLEHFPGTINSLLSAIDDCEVGDDPDGWAERAGFGFTISDRQKMVRRQAMDVLQRRASKQDAKAIQALYTCVEHEESDVRSAALLSLSKIAQRGDQRAIDTALACLQDESVPPLVCEGAIRLLNSISNVGNADVISALLPSLQDPQEYVRHASLDALMVLVVKGDRTLFNNLTTHLENPATQIREFAVKEVGKFVDPSNALEVNMITDRLFDDNEGVREEASHVLRKRLLPDMQSADRLRVFQKAQGADDHIVETLESAIQYIEEVEEGERKGRLRIESEGTPKSANSVHLGAEESGGTAIAAGKPNETKKEWTEMSSDDDS